MNKALKTIAVWIGLLLVCLVAFQLLSPQKQPEMRSYDAFIEDVEVGAVARVRVDNNEIHVTTHDGTHYLTLGVVDDVLTRHLSETGVYIAWGAESKPLRRSLIFLLPMLVVCGFALYFLRKASGSAGNLLTLRKSQARKLSEDDRVVRFDDVGGVEEAKEQLGDMVDFLKHPERWQSAGVRLPRAVLLQGPPGCGKTLIARAVAGEAGVPFYFVSASQFVEMFVGVGAARVRDMFEQARKSAPSVIFIDELDAVGRRRGSGIGTGHDEREQTLNQLLVCLDGFEQNDRVVVLAATNRADILDQALVRAGRFDRRIEIGALDARARRQVLEIHCRDKPLDGSVCLESLAERTEGFSGAELENLSNEAGLLAVRRLRSGEQTHARITAEDFARALAPRTAERHRFDKLDTALIESTTQLAQPAGRVVLRVTVGEREVEGELIWADAGFLKLRTEDGEDVVVSKLQINRLQALTGTEPANDQEIPTDLWARHMADSA